MESHRRVASVLLGVFAVSLVVMTTAGGTGANDSAGASAVTAPASSASCTYPCEPNTPSPATGAKGMAVDTHLSWKIPAPKGCTQFRFLASTGGITGDLNPFSLVVLGTNPEKETAIGPAYALGFVSSLAFAPDGSLYGSDMGLSLIDPGTGRARTLWEGILTPDGRDVWLDGIAFHPNGTLYGVEWDLDTFDTVFYTIDVDTGIATEVCRFPPFVADVWGIAFAPDGTLYGAFAELVKLDLAKGKATIVGRPFSLPFINDIDYAPDGFIYGVDSEESKLYKINPATGSVVQEYGPYSSELWGVASQCVAWSCSGGTATPVPQTLAAPATNGASTLHRPDGRLHAAASELTVATRRGLRMDRLALRRDRSAAGDKPEPSARVSEASSLLQAAATAGGSDIVCDVLLDTVNPPVKVVSRNVLPPTVGNVWTCNPGVLRPDLTYYWRVVARNSCGVTATGPVWSFKTKGPIFQDTFPSSALDPAKWPVVKGARISELGWNEPSPPYSLRLDAYPGGGDSAETATIDLSGYATVTLDYHCERLANGGDTDKGDALVIEYYDGRGWVQCARQPGVDRSAYYYRPVTITLPAASLTAQFKLRFRCIGTEFGADPVANGTWFIDDVILSAN